MLSGASGNWSGLVWWERPLVMAAFRTAGCHFLRHRPPPTPSAFFIPSRGIASKLFVGGVSFFTTEKALSEAFGQFGQVLQATIVMDKVSDRSKGFGFVTFALESEAEKALTEMNGKVLNGRTIYVDRAKIRAQLNYSRPPIARGPPEPPVDDRYEG